MKVLTVKVTAALDAKLSSLAGRSGTTKSALARRMLEDALAKVGRRGQGSFLDLAKDLCGSLEAPEDLSTNPDYMSGYGR